MLPAHRTTLATTAAAIIVACAVACVLEPDDLRVTGQYGGNGIGLVATATEATFQFRCAYARTGPLRLSWDGVARSKGTYWHYWASESFSAELRSPGSTTVDLTVRIGDGPSLSFEVRLDTPPDVAAICLVAGAS